MPVEPGLEPVPVVGLDRMDSEREPVDHVTNEINGAGSVVFFIYFQCPDTCAVVNGRVPVPFYLFHFRGVEGQELDIYLGMVSRDLFGVSFRSHCLSGNVPLEWPYPIPFQGSKDT